MKIINLFESVKMPEYVRDLDLTQDEYLLYICIFASTETSIQDQLANGINYLEEHNITVSNTPELLELFTKLKPAIIKMLLYEIKLTHFGWVLNKINQLTKAGIDWPEFGVIKKSLNSLDSKHLYESSDDDDESWNSWVQWMLHDIRKRDMWSIKQTFDELLAEDDTLSVLDYPEVVKAFNKNKRRMLKSMLTLIKNNIDREKVIGNINGIVLTLIRVKLPWPELKIIKRSLEHEQRKVGQLQETKYNKVTTDAIKVFSMNQAIKYFNQGPNGYHIGLGILMRYDINVKETPVLQNFFESIKKQIIKYLLDQIAVLNFDDNDARYVLATVNDFLRIGLHWKELYTIQNSMQYEYNNQSAVYDNNDDELFENTYDDDQQFMERLVKSFHNLFMERLDDFFDVLRSNNTDDGDISHCLHWIEVYLTPDSQFDLAKKLEPYKKRLIKAILSDMSRSIKAANTSIKALRALGANWPEFDTIQKSIDYELSKSKKLTESNNYLLYDMVNELVTMIVRGDDAGTIVDQLYVIGDRCNDEASSLSKKIVEPFKTKILTAVLSELKHIGPEISLKGMKKAIIGLRKIGVNWPELNIIERSVDHETSKSKKLTEDRDQTWVDNHISRLMKSLTEKDSDDLLIYNIFLLRPNLLTYNLTIPNIADELSLYKHRIISVLLNEVRNDLLTTRYAIQALRRLGVAWPELNIIEKSVDYELEKRYAIA